MNLNQFSRRMRVVAAKTTQNVNDGMRRVALAVDQTVVMATPVDTGRARSNWVVSLGSPSRVEVREFPAGSQGSTAGAAAAEAIARARAVVATYKGEGSIIISNNLPYINRLNEGWSAQAPAGFVEQAVAAGNQLVKGIRVLKGV